MQQRRKKKIERIKAATEAQNLAVKKLARGEVDQAVADSDVEQKEDQK